MDGENQSRAQAVSAASGPVLQESQKFLNRTPEAVNNDARRSSPVKPSSNMSIDMSLVLSDESDIQSEKPCDEYFSPLSEDSTFQPSVRPRPPVLVKQDEKNESNRQAGSTSQQQQQTERDTIYNLKNDSDNIKPSETLMSSRRAKILAKVSSRITRLRRDKKLNDRFTVPKMEYNGPLPELQDLCITNSDVHENSEPMVKEEKSKRTVTGSTPIPDDIAKPLSKKKEPPGKVITDKEEKTDSPKPTASKQPPTRATIEQKVQKLSFKIREDPPIPCPTLGCKTPNPSPAMATTKTKTLDSIPEEEIILTDPSCNGMSPTPPAPPPINTKGSTIDEPHDIPECRTEPETPQMTNCTKSFHTQNLQNLKICVDAYSHTQYLELMESLSMSRGVRTVSVIRKHQTEGIRTRRSADLDHLFHVLHSLSASLSELYLWNFRLQDLTSVSLGLYDHASIQHLQLHMESGTLDEDAAKALGSMPQLVSLELEVNESFPVWPLLDSSSLTVLSVVGDHFVFEAPDFLDISDKLEANNTLQILDLEPRVPAWCLVTLVTSIRSCPDCNLETLQFSCKPKDEQDGDACMLEIIKLMKSLQSKLKVVWNHCSDSFEVSKNVQDVAMISLYVCDTMHQFQVFKESDDYRDLKAHVLERNMRDAVERDSGNMYEL